MLYGIKNINNYYIFIYFFIKIVKPELNIDTNSIIVLILAIIPWIYKNIKSLEISGLGKIEFINEKQKKKIEKKEVNAGI